MITCSSLHNDPLVPSAVTRKLDSENQDADSCCLPSSPSLMPSGAGLYPRAFSSGGFMFPMESLLPSKPDSTRASRRGRSTIVVLHWVGLGHSPKRAFFPLNSKLIFNPHRTVAPSTRHRGNKLNHKTSVWKSNRVLLSIINFDVLKYRNLEQSGGSSAVG